MLESSPSQLFDADRRSGNRFDVAKLMDGLEGVSFYVRPGSYLKEVDGASFFCFGDVAVFNASLVSSLTESAVNGYLSQC